MRDSRLTASHARNATSLDALLAAQIAAEDAVLAQGLEVWSVADPATGEVVLHVMPNDQLPRGGMTGENHAG